MVIRRIRVYLYHDLHPGSMAKRGALQGNSLLISVLLQDRHSTD